MVTILGWVIALFLAGAGAPSVAHAGDPKLNTVSVSLFNHPCTMTGPYSEAALLAVHEISPGKIPPVESAKEAKTLLEQLKSSKRVSTELPPALKPYLEKLHRYLNSQLELFENGAKSKEKTEVRLEPRPDEAFYTVFNKMKIQYSCDFEEKEEP